MPRGVTLIEIVVVLVILSMLLGLSVVVFRNANRDLGVRAAANHCVALVRSVSEHARATQSPAWLVLKLDEEPSIATLTEETVQAWNFENERGAFGKTAIVQGATQVQGREGLAYQFKSSSTVGCGEVPVYAADQGLGLEFWLYRLATRGRQIICTVGEQVEVAVDGAGRIQAKIGGLSLNSNKKNVPLETWVHVKAVHNGSEGRLYLNGVEVDVRPGRSEWTRGASLVLGNRKDGLVGILDTFRLTILIQRDAYYLPREVKFVLPEGQRPNARKEYVIAFTPEGRVTGGAVSFTLKSPAEEKRISISPIGGVVRE